MRSKILILISFCIFLISLIEVVLRIFFNEQLKKRQFPLIYQPDSSFKYTYIPNKQSNLSLPSIENSVTINSSGFYNKEITRQKKVDYYRIGVFGDSNESGIWLNSPNNFIENMNRFYESNKINVEVINFSRDGTWKTISNIKLAKKLAIDYSLDLVILHSANFPFVERDYVREVYKDYVIEYNPNVFKSKMESIRIIDEIENQYIFKTIYNSSYIVRLICKKIIDQKGEDNAFANKGIVMYLNTWITKRFISDANTWYEYTVEKTIDEIINFKLNLNENECEMIYLDYGKQNTKLENFLKYKNLELCHIDIEYNENIHHKHDGHFNELGHKILSDSLIKYFEKRGLKKQNISSHDF